MKPRLLAATTAALLAISLHSAMAQEPAYRQKLHRDQVQHRDTCRLAYRIAVDGGRADKLEWALGYSNGCGAFGGEALAAALPRYRTVSAPGGQLEKLVESAALLTDGKVFSAALALAADRGAGIGARVQAIRIVYHQLNTATFQRYEAFVNDPWVTRTGYVPSVGSEASPIGTPLPANVLAQTEVVVSGVLSDVATPQAVRLAATYLRNDVQIKQARARLCGTGVAPTECTRLLDEWEAEQEAAN